MNIICPCYLYLPSKNIENSCSVVSDLKYSTWLMLLALAFSTKEDSNPQSSGDQAVGVGEVRLRDS